MSQTEFRRETGHPVFRSPKESDTTIPEQTVASPQPMKPMVIPSQPAADPVPPSSLPETPVIPQTPPTPDPQLIQAKLELAALEESRAKLMAELAAERENAAKAQDAVKELEMLKRQRQIAEQLSLDGVELEGLSVDDARKIMAPVLTALKTQQEEALRQISERYDAAAKQQEAQLRERKEREEMTTKERTNTAILAKFPNLLELQQSAPYAAFMAQRVGNYSHTYGQLIADEYQKGNPDGVIAVLNTFMQSQSPSPELDDVAQVAPTMTATQPASDSGATVDDELTFMSKLKLEFQSGAITREEMRDKLAKYRATQQTK